MYVFVYSSPLDFESEVTTVRQTLVPDFMNGVSEYYLLSNDVTNTFEQVRHTVIEEVTSLFMFLFALIDIKKLYL